MMFALLLACAYVVPASEIPPQGIGNTKMPSVLLKNAAKPGTQYPMTGLGLHGSGWKLGQKEECWHYPVCCTKDYCPAINATRDWLKMGGWRLDTGYPYGDLSPAPGSPTGHGYPDHWWDMTCGGWKTGNRTDLMQTKHNRQLLGHACDAEGTRIGIEQSGVDRQDLFITAK